MIFGLPESLPKVYSQILEDVSQDFAIGHVFVHFELILEGCVKGWKCCSGPGWPRERQNVDILAP